MTSGSDKPFYVNNLRFHVPEHEYTYHIRVEPDLKYKTLFERIAFIPDWINAYDNMQELQPLLDKKIKTKYDSQMKYVIANEHTMKYLLNISPFIIELIENAYFDQRTNLLPYTPDDDNYSSTGDMFWMGDFIRKFSSEEIKNSCIVMGNLSNFCFYINKDSLFLFENTMHHYNRTMNSINIPKNKIDFSTYDKFIKSLNHYCKRIRIAGLKPSDGIFNQRYYTHSTYRYILHAEYFSSIQNVYEEIINRGYDE